MLPGLIGGPANLEAGPLLVKCTAPSGPALATVPIDPPASSVPVVSSLSPSSGRAFTAVLIRGTNFRGARSVQFGTHRAMFLPMTSSLIIALAPSAPTARST